MDITSLGLECDSKGRPKVSVWAKCHSADDIDDIIAWLRLAKDMMAKWEKIRTRHEKTARTPAQTAGKHENPQQGQVQDQPQ